MKNILIFFIILFFTFNLYAADYYVDDDSNVKDRWTPTATGNNGTGAPNDSTLPYRDIQYVIDTYPLSAGDNVYVDTGIYNEKVVIGNTDDGNSSGYVTFKGVASGGTNSVIDGTGASNWAACVELNGVNYIKIDSLYIRYQGVNSDMRGLLCYNTCSNLLIVNNSVVSNGREGLRLANGGGIYYSIISNNKCNYNVRVNDSWPAGILIAQGYSNRIIKNECLYNGANSGNGRGIRVEDVSYHNTFISNNCSFNMNIGIEIVNQGSQSRYNTLIGNTCEGNTNEGIVINHPDNIIKKNIIKNNKVGIKFEIEGTNSTVLSNKIYNNSSDGMQVLVTCNGITNNKIYKNNGCGIKVDGANPNINTIKGNEIYSNSSHGIALFRGNNIVKSNQINNNNKGIEVNWDGTNSFIIGNEIYNNSGYGIDLLKSKNTISNNMIYNCSHGIRLSDNIINNKILKNEIYNNTSDGIVGEGGDYNTIISNNIHHNSASGIAFWCNTNSYNIFKKNKIWKNNSDGLNIIGFGNIIISNQSYSNGNFGIKLNGINKAPLTNEYNICYDNTWEGIMIDNAGSGSLVKNCTLFRNGADGIELNGGSLLVKNCISISNTGQGYNQSAGTMTVNYCDAYGNTGGAYDSAATNNCMINAPEFESTNPCDTDFLHLSGGSPCINAGDPADEVPIGGGTRIDIGAYEFMLGAGHGITSIIPNSSCYGMDITIEGTNFGLLQGSSSVKFNSVLAPNIIFWSETNIKVTVPDAANGNVVIQKNGADSNGVLFTFKNSGIISITPSSADVGSEITVQGTNFGIAAGNYGRVIYSNTTASIVSWATNEIKFLIPVDSYDGKIYATNAGGKSTGISFDILSPEIKDVSTNYISAGNNLTISGTNFGSPRGSSIVKFSNSINSVIGANYTWNHTSIVVTVPSGLAVDSTNDIIIISSGGYDITNKAVIIINAHADIIQIGSHAPSVSPLNGKTTTLFTFSVYYRDGENDPPIADYPKIVTTRNGVSPVTNLMLTNVSSGAWTNGRLCQCSITIPFEHSNISNFFLVKAASGNIHEHKTSSFKLVSRVDDNVAPAVNLTKVEASINSMTVKWTIQETYIASQTIFWNTASPASSGLFADIPISETSYQIENLIPGVDYYIAVRTFDDIGNYSDSGEMIMKTIGRLPTEKLEIWNNLISSDKPTANIWVNNPENPDANMIIKIYTIYGKLVKELVNASLKAVKQPIEWDGTDNGGNKVPSGVYIIYGTGYKYNEKKRVYVVK